MRRAVACALAMVLLTGVPAAAFADDSEHDTHTALVEVAVESDDAGDESEDGSPASSSPSAEPASPSAAEPASKSSAEPSSPSKASSSSTGASPTSSAQKAPATGDGMLLVMVTCLVLALSSLLVAVAARRAGARRRE